MIVLFSERENSFGHIAAHPSTLAKLLSMM